MIDKKIIGILLIVLVLVVVSGCSQKSPSGTSDKNIKSEGDVKKVLENATSDIQGLSQKLNDLDKTFEG